MTSYQTVNQSLKVFAGHVTKFCLDLIARFSEDDECCEVVERFLEDLFYNVPDTADYRRTMAQVCRSILIVSCFVTVFAFQFSTSSVTALC